MRDNGKPNGHNGEDKGIIGRIDDVGQREEGIDPSVPDVDKPVSDGEILGEPSAFADNAARKQAKTPLNEPDMFAKATFRAEGRKNNEELDYPLIPKGNGQKNEAVGIPTRVIIVQIRAFFNDLERKKPLIRQEGEDARARLDLANSSDVDLASEIKKTDEHNLKLDPVKYMALLLEWESRHPR